MDNSKKIDLLKKKIEFIEKKQTEFQVYISNLKEEIDALAPQETKKINPLENLVAENSPAEQKAETISKPKLNNTSVQGVKAQIKTKSYFEQLTENLELKNNLENFIGTNLINKIGILILIFGVVIGSKYAIDNNLISPLARIVIGYSISLSLLVFALKLKPKYLNFSAVLLSGALALLYILSYIAYDFYAFIPQSVAFILMFVFTLFAVLASLSYNKMLIALIGLVGSYAVPFLLSSNSGNILFLFSYMSIINIGILYISFKKNWKILFYSAFGFTWLIFFSWFAKTYTKENFLLGIGFATLFFLIFYTTFIAYKVIKKEAFAKVDVLFILLNSFIYFAIGYSLLENNEATKDYLGLFAVVNAVVHFVVSKIFFTKEKTDEKIFYLATGLVFIFITMAIPIQLNGNWVTLLWSLEALLLFWLGRTKKVETYEKISYPLILLSFFSLLQDWILNLNYGSETPFLNPVFLTAIIAAIVYGFLNYIHFKNELKTSKKRNKILNWILPVVFGITAYLSFAFEISSYFENIYSDSIIALDSLEEYSYDQINYNILIYRDLAILFYSIVYVLLAAFINFKKINNIILSKFTLVASLFLLLLSLSYGLLVCSDLRTTYLNFNPDSLHTQNALNLYIRYINFAFIALLVYSIYIHLKKEVVAPQIAKYFNLLLHLVVLWFLSSELLHWLDIFGNKNAYKLALSILWGSYSLLMVIIGLWKNLKYTRVAAIALFAVTLIKLFLYDISNLSAIYKTVVLIILGVLLLVISFLYTKYSNKTNIENEK